MSGIQVMVLILLGAFYILYFGKAYMLRRQGITANLLGKGDKPRAARKVEYMLRASTLLGGAIQFISAIFYASLWPLFIGWPFRAAGVVAMLVGILAFAAALASMKDNWRAGFSNNQNTKLVTSGIYHFSRNPAFAGFDLLYIGCALALPNALNLLATLLAVALFHLQIKGEEAYLRGVFGKHYEDYAAQVLRYIGRRRVVPRGE